MEKEVKLDRKDYEFYGECHDLLRDAWNEKWLENNPKLKERVRKLLGAKEGELI